MEPKITYSLAKNGDNNTKLKFSIVGLLRDIGKIKSGDSWMRTTHGE